MHTVELLDEAIALATKAGFQVRQDWFGGNAAGACELKGQKWLFLDLSLSPHEQLSQVLEALRGLPAIPELTPSPALRSMLSPRMAA
jgi:hypothetical protein